MTSDRVEALEMTLAHAEAEIRDLSDEVNRQGREIDALKREVARLTRSLQAILTATEDGDAPPADQPPPHW